MAPHEKSSNTDVYFLVEPNMLIRMVVNHTVYPFRPPRFQDVTINEYSYRDLIVTQSMMKHHSGKCPCCKSMLCLATSQWAPTTTLAEIVVEICNNLTLKRRIVDKIFARVVARKYLVVPDLESVLQEYL